MKPKTLLLIDANSLLHRAFHALPPLSTPKGEMVHAVYGFLSIMFKAIKEFQPSYIAAAFDVAAPTKRHKKFTQYKATRVKAPDELYSQFPLAKEALAAFHIPVYEKEGYEADDIIGTLAGKASGMRSEQPIETIIVSGDLDTLQLVDKNTKVYTMRKGLQETALWGQEAIAERFGGLKPAQLLDYKGLRGDPSDNIPGVAGVGEKTALQLIGEFGSLEALYNALEKKTSGAQTIKPKLKEKLLSEKEQAFLSKELVTIEKEAPVDFHLEDLAWEDYDQEAAAELLLGWDFRSLVQRMPGERREGLKEGRGSQRDMFRESVESKIEKLHEEQVLSNEVYELEKRLTPVLRNMEEKGLKIDKPYFAKLGQEMQKEIEVYAQRIHEMARKNFNVNSTQQLSEVLFGLPPDGLGISLKGLKKTPKGVVSTASPELEKLQEDHPVIREVLSYRELQKLYTTYVKPLPLLADSEGRIHTHFDQLGAATGRVSSSEPNLQNIPNQGDWGRRIRRGFIAKEGYKLVSFDYSQMELRIAAHIAGDKRMQQFFREGADIHRMTASTVFGMAPGEVTDQMRFRAKALNFGVLYGMGVQGFAKSAGIPTQEARDFIENYFVRFPQLHEYMEHMKEFAREHGYVETIMGRRRYIPEIHSIAPQLRSAAERMAINHPIQGSLADIVKMAMVRIEEQLPDPQGKRSMLLQVHDELLFEIADGIMEEIIGPIRRIMEQAGKLDVPVRVDVKKGKNWNDVEKVLA
ncbi:MAG TPA: DNA polymerase [Candidatus Paceibacterota bacterium]|nr:DNA polymerase [Candidatus Paceibacterota bacterium]